MATIELYKNKINSMATYLEETRSAVGDLCSELSSLKSKVLGINSSLCEKIVSHISISTQAQEQQITGLEATKRQVNEFITLTINRDNKASSQVSKAKKDFYKKYSYLKPECEKTDWEKFCDGLKAVGEFCKEHWKLIVTVVICIAAVALICTGVGGILGAAALGALIGAGSGGLIGGITSVLAGGSFLEGFEEGAFSGAITGAIMGGLGGAGAMFGKTLQCGTKIANLVKGIAKVSGVMSTVMGGFDTLAFGLGMLDSDNPITALNSKLHQSKLYNAFQIGVSAVATFTGAAAMNTACFVAGTLVLTASGLKAIESLATGEKVITAHPDTLESGEKTILETYIRQVSRLVYLTIGSEVITTTENHPFYVQGRGFTEAGKLLPGDLLISADGKDLSLEECRVEDTETPVSVYNFQVEDFHTYFVGDCRVWVHNDCDIEFKNRKYDKDEYKQQLKDQQDGLGDLTIDEYLSNRKAYNERKAATGSGRDPQSAKYQKSATEKAITQKQNELMRTKQAKDLPTARKMAQEWASDKAALHGPDQIAGGYAKNISGLGDSKINSSIGSQWRSSGRIGKLDNYIQEQAKIYPGSTKLSELNIRLIVK